MDEYSYDVEYFNNMGLIIIEGVQKRRPLDLHFIERYNYYLKKLNEYECSQG